ncbi:Gag-pro-like protein [Gossypium australe]|uniref:Gag-pro-like protein n=1 Tax=Gossypium australe TaxID=47621 RepID=A0A5B6VKF0_9ROSI|nr:Gag-pro-like protein [Gossypium australe]
MKECQSIVKAFDGTKRKVLGKIEIPLLIGPTTYEVDFLVMDIKPSYNCLLGRPWIHSSGAVPSLLHQKVKLVADGRLITIKAEEDIIAAATSEMTHLEINDETTECSFRSLEFVNATFITEGNRIPIVRISKTTRMGLKMTVGKGALPGRGLGKYLQGRVVALTLREKQDRFGLGFRPDARQKKKELEKRQERRRARLRGEETKWEPMIISHISKTFVSGGVIHAEPKALKGEDIVAMLGDVYINAISEEAVEERTLSDIQPYEPGSVLDNWTAKEIPVVFKAYSE